jgi:hypothetical protein
MVMTIPQLNKKLDNVVKEVTTRMGDTMVGIGNHALMRINERIIKTGVNAKGQKYTPYSTKPMLIGCKGFKNKAHCSKVFGKKKNKELKWVTLNKVNSAGRKIRLAVLPGGYKQFRELNNLQSGHVDFSFTNKMWNDISIISNKSEADKGTVRIGAKAETEKKKLAGNTERRGDILMLNDKEIAEITKLYGMSIQQIIDKNLG